MKVTLKILLLFVILLKSSYVLPDELIPKNTSIYTSWDLTQSDHCTGYTFTFIQSFSATKGYFQAYNEGNCFSEKIQVNIIKFNKKTGALQFIIPHYIQFHGRDDDLRFSGIVKNNTLKGKVQFCKTNIKECIKSNYDFPKSENVLLNKTDHETL